MSNFIEINPLGHEFQRANCVIPNKNKKRLSTPSRFLADPFRFITFYRVRKANFLFYMNIPI
jgi:hypothetical protein